MDSCVGLRLLIPEVLNSGNSLLEKVTKSNKILPHLQYCVFGVLFAVYGDTEENGLIVKASLCGNGKLGIRRKMLNLAIAAELASIK
ncbi:MAG: hypothetical protein ACFB0G_04245 [Leptolyngbyaceae cyanobacterium]